ncbi:hypothetical protein MIR68_010505 [Amoeboaphelidium protococcarum]|nr:hypothetical protein MIR68_010505 [Amoeboaphelidium protococcarum]
MSQGDISTSINFGNLFRGIFKIPAPVPPELPQPIGEGVCLQGANFAPVILSANNSCPQHFYCPNTSPDNPISNPQMCPPTLKCQSLRLTSNFCEPQGLYEPVPCPKGFYCPNPREKIICPENHYCPTGRVVPIPCTQPMSICPEGSFKQSYYGGLLVAAVMDVFIVILLIVLKCRGLRDQKRRAKKMNRMKVGRNIGTISEVHMSDDKSKILFLTKPSSEELDDQDDFDGSTIAGKKRGFKAYYRRRLIRFINWVGMYLPIHVNIKSPEETKKRPTAVNNHQASVGAYAARPSHSTIDIADNNPYGRSSVCSAAATFSRNRAQNTVVTKVSSTHFSHNLHDLLHAFKRAQNGQDLSLHFEFDRLSLTLPSGKCILNGVNGLIVPNRVTVIMGPSGAGKSTFMNVLTGKLNRTGGKLLINGKEVEMHKYKKIIGYVPQDDVMLEELTVRENIAYSAKTRLPRSWSSAEVEKFVDEVLDALELSHVANNMTSAVSGGQRKRVNIGMELATAPSAIFLDEPTSGLDSTAALKVANIMKRTAQDIGITVVAVVHQPRYEIFEQFDDVLMIAQGGNTAYLGPREEVLDYFESLGFYFNPKNNPADVLMDILSGKGQRLNPSLLPQNIDSQNLSMYMQQLVEDGKAEFVEYDVKELSQAWMVQEDFNRNDLPDLSYLNRRGPSAQMAMTSATPVNQLNDIVVASSEFDQESTTKVGGGNQENEALSINDQDLSDKFHDSFEQPADVLSTPDDYVESLKDLKKRTSRNRLSTFYTDKDVEKDGSERGLGDADSASYQSLSESHDRLRQACKERGANPMVQLVNAHNRSMLQQYRRVNAFFIELGVAVVTGSLMGLAVTSYNGGLYQGLLIVPFTLLSPAPIEVVIPILCLLVSCAIGLSAAPAAVKVFSEERDVYYREASTGHSPWAYYVGKNVASTYRFVITSWHFCSLYHFFATPNISFYLMFYIHLLMFFCVYGMSFALGMMVRRENASMTAVCLAVVMAALCGGGPNLADMQKINLGWILDLSYARWGAEAWYSEELLLFDGVFEIYNVSAAVFGFTLGRYLVDIIIMIIIGCVWRVIGYLLLICLNRQKQR